MSACPHGVSGIAFCSDCATQRMVEKFANEEQVRAATGHFIALAQSWGGWVVGSAAKLGADLDVVRDFDIMIPFAKWHDVAPSISAMKGVRANSFGGWKVPLEDGRTMDVWPDDLGRLASITRVESMWHPASGARFERK